MKRLIKADLTGIVEPRNRSYGKADRSRRAHMETGLNYDIAQGKVSEIPSQKPYYTAGALNEAEIDYVFNHVGFSSTSTLYSLPVNGDALERAEKALAEREKERAEKAAGQMRTPMECRSRSENIPAAPSTYFFRPWSG